MSRNGEPDYLTLFHITDIISGRGTRYPPDRFNREDIFGLASDSRFRVPSALHPDWVALRFGRRSESKQANQSNRKTKAEMRTVRRTRSRQKPTNSETAFHMTPPFVKERRESGSALKSVRRVGLYYDWVNLLFLHPCL